MAQHWPERLWIIRHGESQGNVARDAAQAARSTHIETGGREVQSTAIGTKVLEKLKDIDEVAYLRYASVHRRFEGVDQFVEAVQALGRRIKTNPSQRELFPPDNVTHGSV